MSAELQRPTLDDRRADYAAWRSKLNQRAAENKASVEEVVEVSAPSTDWSPEGLFSYSSGNEA